MRGPLESLLVEASISARYTVLVAHQCAPQRSQQDLPPRSPTVRCPRRSAAMFPHRTFRSCGVRPVQLPATVHYPLYAKYQHSESMMSKFGVACAGGMMCTKRHRAQVDPTCRILGSHPTLLPSHLAAPSPRSSRACIGACRTPIIGRYSPFHMTLRVERTYFPR